ncbi:hypothetical protein OESDEN_19436, partial [Oesophagostomum dentatum]
VTDTRGHFLYKREKFSDTKGKFAFTTDEYDIFEICISNHAPVGAGQAQAREVLLKMKHGIEAKNYDDVAKAEKLKPLEVELRRLEDLSDQIVKDFAFMRQREEEMRNTNGMRFYKPLSVFSILEYFSIFRVRYMSMTVVFASQKLIFSYGFILCYPSPLRRVIGDTA